MVINCQSIKNKIDDFFMVVRAIRPSIILGSESWLDSAIADSEVFPPEYQCFRRDRSTRGGGVFILVSSNIPSVMLDCSATDIECVFCRIRLQNGKGVVVGSYYRPPGTSYEQFLTLSEYLETIKGDQILIGGDFNLPHINWSCNEPRYTAGGRLYSTFFDILDSYAFKQYVHEASRNDGTGHVLDLLLCNRPDIVSNVHVLPGVSDHNIVVADVNVQNISVPKKVARKVYAYSRANYDAINLAFENYFPTFDTLADELNIEQLWKVFKEKLFHLRETFVPTRVLSAKRTRDKPWFNTQLRTLLRRIRRIYVKCKKNNSLENQSELKRLKLNFQNLATVAKNSYFSSLGKKLVEDTKQFWRYVRLNGKENTSVPPLKCSHAIVDDDASKVDIFSTYFSSVFRQSYSRVVNTVFSTEAEEMPEVTFSVSGIQKLLENVKPEKACGPDDIPAAIIRNCSATLSLYFHCLFRKCLFESALPDDWKLARVTPIHKNGPKNDVENYRPVSLTSITCKIFEHVLYSCIMSHLVKHNLLHPSQHGFRQGFSCSTQLVEFTHDLALAIDKRKVVDCIFLDFRKAFDIVPHDLLVSKLRGYKLNESVIAWIAEYLSLRQQSVVLNGCSSGYVPVTSGVPQGSVLGPLLFLLYINDIAIGLKSSFRMFADDCVLYRTIDNERDSEYLQHDLNVISSWCTNSEMSLNVKKCVHVTFTRKHSYKLNTYSINNAALGTAREHKYLGVYFTSDLRWTRHVYHIKVKAARVLGFLRRNFSELPSNLKEQLYFTHVRSLLEYACVCWDPYTKELTDTLEKIQNRAVRFVLGNWDRQLSMRESKSKLKWEDLKDRRRNLRLKFFHNIYHSKTGIDKDKYIQAPSYISKRRDHNLKVNEFSFKGDVLRYSFFVRSIHEWNDLPPEIVSIVCNDGFYHALRK